MADPRNINVTVTGASGFIGTHIVRELLERGYAVRGTVRDRTNAAKVNHLERFGRELPGTLELFEANLDHEGGFDEAMAGATWVVHTATAVMLASRRPQEEIVDPSVEGTRNVYGSIARSGSVKRIAHTASVASMQDFSKPRPFLHTEDMWNDKATLKTDPYGLAKTRGERLARKLAAEAGVEIVTIHPSLVLGPCYTAAHSAGSPSVVRDLVSNAFPGCPRLFFATVDVREVAKAHVEALERPEASGRYILSSPGRWMRELSEELAELFPELRLPKRNLPNVLLYIASLFDARMDFAMLRNFLGNPLEFDGSRCTRELGIVYRPLSEALRDTAESLIQGGWARTKRR